MLLLEESAACLMVRHTRPELSSQHDTFMTLVRGHQQPNFRPLMHAPIQVVQVLLTCLLWKKMDRYLLITDVSKANCINKRWERSALCMLRIDEGRHHTEHKLCLPANVAAEQL